MKGVSNGESQHIIDDVNHYIKRHAPLKECHMLQLFSQRYFAACSVDDIKDRSIEELYAILLSQWNFMRERAAGTAKVRVFNPTMSKDGWNAAHTVIQISHDDIPFVVDSARMVVNSYGFQIHFIIHFGGLKVIRDHQHRIVEILAPGVSEANASSTAPIYIEIDRLIDHEAMSSLEADIENVLKDVRASVADWRQMVDRVEDCLHELEQNPPNVGADEMTESRDFLRWLIDNNFSFLGARDYKLIGDGTNRALQIVRGSGLGVLREESSKSISKTYAELPPQARKMALSKNILIIAKTNTISTVHREAYTDYIGVKRFNEKGELIGERRFIGLYTSTAYHTNPRQIP